MAKIKHQGMGNATVVLLDVRDRRDLSAALLAFAADNGLSMSAVAKTLGVNRTYLYSLLDANQIELSRLLKIQDLVDFRLVSDSDVHLYLQNLWHSITGRSIDQSWLTLCEHVGLDAYYVKRFLLPAMVQEVGSFAKIYSLADSLQPESVLPSFSSEVYFASLVETYLNNTIDALGGEYGEIDTQFHEGDEPLRLDFPVLLSKSIWLDVFELAQELIFDYHQPSEGVDGATVDSYRLLYDGDETELSDLEVERFQADLDFLRVMESHAFAEKYIIRCAEDIDTWTDSVIQYCTQENRVLRRRLYFPLELKRAAEQPTLYSVPVVLSQEES